MSARDLLVSQLMALDAVRSAGGHKEKLSVSIGVRGELEDVPEHVYRVADRFDLTVLHRGTSHSGLELITRLELAEDDRVETVLEHYEARDDDGPDVLA